MRIRLEATSVGIGTEKAVERTGIEKCTYTLRQLEFFRAYLVPGQLVNPGYATVSDCPNRESNPRGKAACSDYWAILRHGQDSQKLYGWRFILESYPAELKIGSPNPHPNLKPNPNSW